MENCHPTINFYLSAYFYFYQGSVCEHFLLAEPNLLTCTLSYTERKLRTGARAKQLEAVPWTRPLGNYAYFKSFFRILIHGEGHEA